MIVIMIVMVMVIQVSTLLDDCDLVIVPSLSPSNILLLLLLLPLLAASPFIHTLVVPKDERSRAYEKGG